MSKFSYSKYDRDLKFKTEFALLDIPNLQPDYSYAHRMKVSDRITKDISRITEGYIYWYYKFKRIRTEMVKLLNNSKNTVKQPVLKKFYISRGA
jgi:hypothetical protein